MTCSSVSKASISSSSTEDDKELVVPIDLVATIGNRRPVITVSESESWTYPGTAREDKEGHSNDEILVFVRGIHVKQLVSILFLHAARQTSG